MFTIKLVYKEILERKSDTTKVSLYECSRVVKYEKRILSGIDMDKEFDRILDLDDTWVDGQYFDINELDLTGRDKALEIEYILFDQCVDFSGNLEADLIAVGCQAYILNDQGVTVDSISCKSL